MHFHIAQDDNQAKEKIPFKFRVSCTGEETDLMLNANDTVLLGKLELSSCRPGKWIQRWYYGGRLLQDRLRLRDLKIPPGHVVQVIFNESPMPQVSH